MTKLLFFSIFTIAILAAFSNLYLTSALYYIFTILQPKYIWPWTYPDFRFNFYISIFLLIGFIILIIRNKVRKCDLFSKESFLLIFIFLMFKTSDYFSNYQLYSAGIRGEIVIDALTTITILYFVQISAIIYSRNPVFALKIHSIVFITCCTYYIYWCNFNYVTNNWAQFRNGRLTGPLNSPYADENILSVLIVMSIPFFLNAIFYSRNLFQKLIFSILLILSWHSVFLMGSRGAFLATIIVVILSFKILGKSDTDYKRTLIFKKSLSRAKIIILATFVILITTQASTVLNRSTEVVDNAKVEDGEAINPRIISWEVGLDLAFSNPILGVGPQRFQHASNIYYPGKTIHVAHNTYINFAANVGFPCSIAFLYLLYSNYNSRRKIASSVKDNIYLNYLNDSCHLSIIGFFICSIFLDLIIFEPIYFIFVIVYSLKCITLNTNET